MIPRILLEQLGHIEPQATFSGNAPRIQSSSGKAYFAKCGTPAEVDQYAGEAESLRAIHSAAPGLAPRVLSSGVDDTGIPFFISEYKKLNHLGNEAAKALATRLATELHLYKSSKGFGFPVATCCGATRLENGWFPTWEQCFGSMMVLLLEQLEQKSSYEGLCRLGTEVVQKVLPKLLGPLKIEPVLLHGDLWSGNVGMDDSGMPFIFDPSTFYGHNEADLAIARIFGGFPPMFYSTYQELQPISDPVDDYQVRCDLYKLFHYLNHTVLFGASYASSAQSKMDKLLRWAADV